MADDNTDNSAVILTDLEHLIKTHIANLDKLRREIKTQREMVTSALENDETYRTHHEKVKEAMKVRGATKKQILSLPQNKTLVSKILEQTAELRESDGELSEYLREFQRLSGSNEIEGDDGEIREIVYVAKLVKKSSKKR